MAVARLIRSDGLSLQLAETVLPIPESVVRARPGLARYVDRDVAIGIRSEDMEDASLARDNAPESRVRAKVALTEALGSEIVVHFDVAAPKPVTADTKALDKDAQTSDVPVAHRGNVFVASFGPRSRVRPRDDIEIVVDRERIHFFDPDTGHAVRD
jgi:multiple sugar transport system ATP-binding protein